MTDAFEKFRGTMPVQERHRFEPTRLARYLREHIPGFPGTLELR
jgi:hypothetical protein